MTGRELHSCSVARYNKPQPNPACLLLIPARCHCLAGAIRKAEEENAAKAAAAAAGGAAAEERQPAARRED